MRQKRAKTYKRVMALYQTAFSFRQPYQVLVSDDFLIEAVSKDVDVLKQLSTCVQGQIKPMITQCCVEALYRLGKDHNREVAIAKGFERRRCNHRTAIEPSACLTEMIGDTNKHRYVLCTASPPLLISLSPVPGLPIIHFNPRGVLVLSPPSTATVRAKNAVEEDRRLEGARVLDGVTDGANVVGGDERGQTGGQAGAGGAGRKARAKNPNPLSVKKKKVKSVEGGDAKGKGKKRERDGEERGEVDGREEGENGEIVDGAGDEGEGEGEEGGLGAEPSRKRKKRKRTRGKGAVAAAIAEIRAEGEARANAGDGDDAGSGSDDE